MTFDISADMEWMLSDNLSADNIYKHVILHIKSDAYHRFYLIMT